MDYPKVSQNKKWDAELFDHQLTAIHMLEDREENNFRIIANENETVTINTNIGVYADPVGYGKTLAVAGLLSRDKMEWDVSTHYKHHEIIESNSCGINLCITKIKNYKKINTSLLVVNQSIIDPYLIASMELEEKKIPFIIRRPLPNGASEYWKLKDLELVCD